MFSPKVMCSKLCLKSCCPCFCSPQHKIACLIKERKRAPKDKTSRDPAETFRLHPGIGAKRNVGSRVPFFNLPWKVADGGKVQQMTKQKQHAAFSSKKPLEAANTSEITGPSSKKLLKPRAASSTSGLAKSGRKGLDWQWVMGEILKREHIIMKIQEMEEILKMDEILSPFAERTWRRAMQTRMRIRLKRNTVAGKISQNLCESRPGKATGCSN